MALNLESLQTALTSLQEALALCEAQPSSTPLALTLRDGVIQRFEYTYEVAWKIIQRWLMENVNPEAVAQMSRKDLYRMAAQKGLIADPQCWFDFHSARNLSTHTYDPESAKLAYSSIPGFVNEIAALIKRLH